ncbi:hypothetical protein AK812_SmicGene11335 [Symbiodinium microadriaticum]|uniref:Uncharacterized protein n=1 Tax=Symbiodinium microadriaticum TaxID=2951 RepID=A0A1Q9EDH6_SYMMI|nr:hypothetical protein AK812_SmicGene11335 [Symbiodinium microadriaticum]
MATPKLSNELEEEELWDSATKPEVCRRFRTTWQYPLPAPAPDPWYAAVNMQSTISTGAASYAENAAARAETALKSAELRGSASPYQTIRTNYG